jgi:hypothetical protein
LKIKNNKDMAKEEKREKAFEKIHSILEKAWDDISEIAENELGVELDYENNEYIHEYFSEALEEYE